MVKYHGKKDFSKFAWFSRVTVPVLKLDLVVHCQKKRLKDFLEVCRVFFKSEGFFPRVMLALKDTSSSPRRLTGK